MKYFLPILATLFLFSACEPQQDDGVTLPAAPSAVNFSIEETEPNTYLLTNETADVFQYLWEYNGQTGNGESIEVFFQEAGSYEITLTVFGAGGYARTTKTLDVAEDAPFDCESDATYIFLSNCTNKVWRLNPAEGALLVQPADGSTIWWQSSGDEPAARPCSFDNTWTFTGDGKMDFDTKGDLWGEDYMGFNFECIQESQLAANQAAWGSAEHNYFINTDVTPPQLTINGLGAWIGLPKVTNGAEVVEPVSSTTYDITRMENTSAGDIMELTVNFGPGVWRFTLLAE